MTNYKQLVKFALRRMNNHYRPLDATWKIERADEGCVGWFVRHLLPEGEDDRYHAQDLREAYAYLEGVQDGVNQVLARLDQHPKHAKVGEVLKNALMSEEARRGDA